jgi:hypothetical protein
VSEEAEERSRGNHTLDEVRGKDVKIVRSCEGGREMDRANVRGPGARIDRVAPLINALA